MRVHPTSPGPRATRALRAGGLVCVLLLSGGLIHLSRPGGPFALVGPRTVVVENRLLTEASLDIRTVDLRGTVVGPHLRTVHPGDDVTFSTGRGAPACLRLVDPRSGRIVRIGLEWPNGSDTLRLRVTPASLRHLKASTPRCDPRLAEHRVRLGWGRYFDPDAPDRVLRDSFLRGR